MIWSAVAALAMAGGDSLDLELAAIAEKAKLPGLGVALVSSIGLEWSFYSGVKKAGGADKVGPETKWHLGSDTKTMTAITVCRQVEAGRLKLDEELKEVFKDGKTDAGFEGVTLRHLLAHQAGLKPNLNWWGLQSSAAGDTGKARLAAVREALEVAPESEKGQFVYSNTGFVLAGAAAEQASGQTVEELIRAELEPLGIRSLGFGPTGEKESWPHTEGNPTDSWDNDNPAVMTAAGRAHMSLPDWGKFISEVLRGLEGKGSKFPAVYFDEITKKPLGGDYTMGWITTERGWAKGLALTHAGSNTMNYCVVWVAPGVDKAVLVVTNTGGEAVPGAVDECVGAVIRAKF